MVQPSPSAPQGGAVSILCPTPAITPGCCCHPSLLPSLLCHAVTPHVCHHPSLLPSRLGPAITHFLLLPLIPAITSHSYCHLSLLLSPLAPAITPHSCCHPRLLLSPVSCRHLSPLGCSMGALSLDCDGTLACGLVINLPHKWTRKHSNTSPAAEMKATRISLLVLKWRKKKAKPKSS